MIDRVLRLGVLAASLAWLVACAPPPSTGYASDSRVASAAFRAPGPSTLTLITMVNNRTGDGGHSALMISASQRVIFDPAGSFENAAVPEQQDVLYGITPAVFFGYRSAHARSTHHVVTQRLEVSAEQAELALRLAQDSGAVLSAFCAQATSQLLGQIPGLETISPTFRPVNLQEQFQEIPGVRIERYYEDDDGTILDGIAKVEL